MPLQLPAITVLGSLNMDLVSYVPHHPLPGETITSSSFIRYCGGKGANQAVACAKLSRSDCSSNPTIYINMIGAVGNDEYGSTLLKELQRYGFNTTEVLELGSQDVGSMTGSAVIIIDESNGQNRIILSPGTNHSLRPEHIVSISGPKPDLLILQLEIALETTIQACKVAESFGIPVLLNPAPAQQLPDHIYKGLAHFILNETEAAILSDVHENDLANQSTLEDITETFLYKGVQNIVITLGARGAFYATRTGKRALVPACKVKVVDTTAAGDTFIGSYATEVVEALVQNKSFDIERAVTQAIRASAKAISRKGAQDSIPWKGELE